MKQNHRFYLTPLIVFLFLILLSACKDKNSTKEMDIYFKLLGSKSIQELDSILKKNINLSNSKKGLLYLKKGKKLSEFQKDKKAINDYQKALFFLKKGNSKKYIAETYWNLGSTYAFLSEKVEANTYLNKALNYNKDLKNPTLQANIYNSLAHVYYLYQDYEKAFDYIFKAIEIQKKEKEYDELSATYHNLAVIYKHIGDFDNALKYNLKSLELNKKADNKAAIAKSYNNIGSLFLELKNSNKAKKYFIEALKLNKKIGSHNTTAYRNLGRIYNLENKTDSCKIILNEALKIDQLSKNLNNQLDIYSILLSIALKNKNFNDSYKFQLKKDSLSLLKSKLENQENLKLLANQHKLIIKEKELEQQKKINSIIFGGVFIVTLLSFLFIFQRFKNKKLQTKNKILALEQKVLRSQMNPHFIFNALSAIQNSLLDNEPIKTAGYLSKFAKLIRQNFDFIHQKKITLKEEIDALNNYVATQKLRFQNSFDFKIKIHSDIDLNIIEIPPLLLQPFIENAIEHGLKNNSEKGEIILHIYPSENNQICYKIKDNGKGFNPNKKSPNLHALDVFKKRIKLRNKKEEKSFVIYSSNKGTTIKFCLKND